MWQHFFSRVTFSRYSKSVEALLFYTCSVVMFESVVLCFFPKYLYIPWNFSSFLSFFASLLHYWSSSLRMFSSFPYYTKSDVILNYYIRIYLYKHARNVFVSMTEYVWFGFGQLITLSNSFLLFYIIRRCSL